MNKKLLILSLTLFSTLTSCGVTTSSINPVRPQGNATTVLPSSYAGANFKTNMDYIRENFWTEAVKHPWESNIK